MVFPDRVLAEKIRLSLGVLCIFLAWLFPFFEGASRDTLQQVFSLGMLGVAALLFGMSAVSPVALAVFSALILLIALRPGHYIGGQVAGVAGVLLLVVALHVGTHLQRAPAKFAWLLAAIVAAAFVNAIEGMLQWLGLVGSLAPWVVEPESRGIAYGAFRQRNLFASFLVVGSLSTIWLFYRRALSESMAWFLILILMFGVAASGSRTGILETMVLGLGGLLWKKQPNFAVRRLLFGQTLLLGGAIWVLPFVARWHGFGFISGVSRAVQSGQDARLTIWSNAMELISQQPWTGWGWRETAYGHYVTVSANRYDGLMGNVHNLPLQLAVEFGLPATILLIGAVLWTIFLETMVAIHANTGTQAEDVKTSDRPFAWAMLLLIVGVHSMLEYPLWYAGFLFLTGLALGYALSPPHCENHWLGYRKWSKRVAQLSALALIILAIAAWNQFATVLPIYKTPFTKDREAQRQAIAAAVVNASGSWLFQEQLNFAALGTAEITTQNASVVRALAEKLLHHTAEPAVIRPLLLSLWYLQEGAALKFHTERFCRAFPIEFERWVQQYAAHPMGLAAARSPGECRAMTP